MMNRVRGSTPKNIGKRMLSKIVERGVSKLSVAAAFWQINYCFFAHSVSFHLYNSPFLFFLAISPQFSPPSAQLFGSKAFQLL
jgi:hypothetical protein